MELMQHIPDKIVDMILCDLPYGITRCKWDSIIPLNKLWGQYERVLKKGAVVVLTASQPFTSQLVMSNINWFKYELIWAKNRGGNPLNANIMPMKIHENILIFYDTCKTYNPQLDKRSKWGRERLKYKMKNGKIKDNAVYGKTNESYKYHYNPELKQPISIREVNMEVGLHPTQKPVDLFEWIIKTYTNENDLVLDNCIGSGTTAIACKQLNRNFIGIEKEQKYVDIANKRLQQQTLTKTEKKELIKSISYDQEELRYRWM